MVEPRLVVATLEVHPTLSRRVVEVRIGSLGGKHPSSAWVVEPTFGVGADTRTAQSFQLHYSIDDGFVRRLGVPTSIYLLLVRETVAIGIRLGLVRTVGDEFGVVAQAVAVVVVGVWGKVGGYGHGGVHSERKRVGRTSGGSAPTGEEVTDVGSGGNDGGVSFHNVSATVYRSTCR